MSVQDQQREREHWALDKKVPLAVIVTIVLQTLGAVWWASAQDSRMSSVEASIIEVRSQKLDSRVTVVEDQLRSIGAQMNRIETKLDRLIEREGSGR